MKPENAPVPPNTILLFWWEITIWIKVQKPELNEIQCYLEISCASKSKASKFSRSLHEQAKTETETKKTARTRLRKLDTKSPKEKWLASLASRPLLDLYPRNRAVHNYSKVNFSKRATEVLGLGFKFRPTLKPPKQDDLESQLNTFCRSVRLNTLFSSECTSIDKDAYNPRL